MSRLRSSAGRDATSVRQPLRLKLHVSDAQRSHEPTDEPPVGAVDVNPHGLIGKAAAGEPLGVRTRLAPYGHQLPVLLLVAAAAADEEDHHALGITEHELRTGVLAGAR